MPVSLSAVAAAANTSSTDTTVVSIVIAVAILVFILYRQVQVRRAAPSPILAVAALVLGVLSLAHGSSRPTGAKIGILIVLLALDAGGLGAVRAWTVRLWRDGQDVLRQGTWVTVVLWLVGLAIHEGVDAIAHIPDSSTLLYLGVTLLAQQAVLQTRVNRLAQQPDGAMAGPPAPPLRSPGGQAMPQSGPPAAPAPGGAPEDTRS